MMVKGQQRYYFSVFVPLAGAISGNVSTALTGSGAGQYLFKRFMVFDQVSCFGLYDLVGTVGQFNKSNVRCIISGLNDSSGKYVRDQNGNAIVNNLNIENGVFYHDLNIVLGMPSVNPTLTFSFVLLNNQLPATINSAICYANFAIDLYPVEVAKTLFDL